MIKLYHYYKSLGDKTLERLTDEELNWQYNKESNSVAIIVKHMWGNMLSRWTDFLSSDGEKEWRDRDGEFDTGHLTKEKIMEMWEEGWACVFKALEPLSDTDMQKIVYIRNEGHTVEEAIQRQLAHYAYHVGQIVFVGKMIKDTDWASLSIARNKSKDFNEGKFARDREVRHFSDEK
ncbi:MAG: DUF1572 family protein [Saprospiraceae bacterium]|nr:DUF1572 family protein [Saprospiraceae bacterium]MBK7222473.1 DUF1572 family protein [Saprospiraceae bacterium]MBK9686477.1 DUF1572 family protein [Saprospiraceae bacterium]MBL0082560.1 DUF1572 family protein [Saprospiraceae bacterium]